MSATSSPPITSTQFVPLYCFTWLFLSIMKTPAFPVPIFWAVCLWDCGRFHCPWACSTTTDNKRRQLTIGDIAVNCWERFQDCRGNVLPLLEQLINRQFAKLPPGTGQAELGQCKLRVLNLIAGLKRVSDVKEENSVNVYWHIV